MSVSIMSPSYVCRTTGSAFPERWLLGRRRRRAVSREAMSPSRWRKLWSRGRWTNRAVARAFSERIRYTRVAALSGRCCRHYCFRRNLIRREFRRWWPSGRRQGELFHRQRSPRMGVPAWSFRTRSAVLDWLGSTTDTCDCKQEHETHFSLLKMNVSQTSEDYKKVSFAPIVS